MKKYLFPSLMVLCLTAVSSCIGEDVFTVNNVEELVTVNGDALVSDFGNVFTVTDNQTGKTDWKISGTRYLALFDILNRSLEIKLKQMEKIEIVHPEEKVEWETVPKDPVYLVASSVSGGYANVFFQTYKAKNSDYPVNIFWQIEEKNGSAKLYLYVDGNNENPAFLEQSQLETVNHYVSIPLDFNTIGSLSLTTHVLFTQSEGKYEIVQNTYPFRI